eukprot:41725-Amphidinium_carterae.1
MVCYQQPAVCRLVVFIGGNGEREGCRDRQQQRSGTSGICFLNKFLSVQVPHKDDMDFCSRLDDSQANN